MTDDQTPKAPKPLHEPVESKQEPGRMVCSVCRDFDGDLVEWPCAFAGPALDEAAEAYRQAKGGES